jgi:hypothetical protein
VGFAPTSHTNSFLILEVVYMEPCEPIIEDESISKKHRKIRGHYEKIFGETYSILKLLYRK